MLLRSNSVAWAQVVLCLEEGLFGCLFEGLQAQKVKSGVLSFGFRLLKWPPSFIKGSKYLAYAFPNSSVSALRYRF